MRAPTDRLVLGRSIRDLIGGRWAISWIAYLINAPINLIAIASNAGSGVEGAPWWHWALVSAVGYLGFGLVLLSADVSIMRHRRERPVPVTSVIVVGALSGGVRGAIVGVLAQWWALAPESVSLVLTRVLTGAVLGAVLLPISALILAVIDSYRIQRTTLVSESRELRADAMRLAGDSRELHAALVTSVQSDLAEVERTQDPAAARALSRRIWEDTPPQAPAPRMRWTAVLRASVQHNPYAFVPVSVIWVLSAIGTLTAAIGLGRALAQIAASVACIALVFACARALVARRPRWSVTIFIAAMAVLIALTSPIASLVFDPRPWPAGAGLVVVNALWIPLLTIGIGFVVAAVRSGETVLADLRAQVSEEEITALAMHDERERLRRELATHLHGSVQSRLLVATLSPGDFRVAPDLLDSMATPPAASGSGASLHEQVRAVARPWTALIDITIEIDEESCAALNRASINALARIAEEGITNAYRHGHATAVSVRIGAATSGASITVTDNGTGVAATHGRGLGSALLDSLAPDGWTLTSDASGTTLTARFRS